MLQVRLQSRLSDKDAAAQGGRRADARDIGLVLEQDAAVFKPNGELLLMLKRAALPEQLRADVLPSLQALKAFKTDNRGVYTAEPRPELQFADGSKSKNTRTRTADGKILQVASAVVGYFDRQGGRHPYCRTTRFSATEVEKWEAMLPLVECVSADFERSLPDRWKKQRAYADTIRPEWVIPKTVFTTLTVNNNTCAGIHQDKGDYKEGFGIITCHRNGTYTGGLLCFTQYKVAVDLRDGDILYFNSHDWHGQTPIVGDPGYERITCVYYVRTKMVECGSHEEEIDRARNVRGSL